jgi:light-regulated signal transduction histidine kinase (bacteriophytochrome)
VALYSQMLQKKYGVQLDAQAEQYLSYVTSGAHRMETLLRDLLTYSQTGLSPAEGPAMPVACSEALRKALLNLQASIDRLRHRSQGMAPTIRAHGSGSFTAAEFGGQCH